MGRIARRAAATLLLAWALGFALFAVLLPQPAGDVRTDAVVVMTGGSGRIARGLDVLAQGRARRMLISGVDPAVKPGELAATQHIAAPLLACCIDLGREAIDTRSNGAETAAWLAARKFKSVRLVTTDWHMRRARLELENALGQGITIVPDAVPGEAGLGALVLEYHKFLARRIAVAFGL